MPGDKKQGEWGGEAGLQGKGLGEERLARRALHAR